MADQGVRKYCTSEPGHANHNTCNFCGLTMKGGGITRVKLHLSGDDTTRSVRKCEKCPPEVRREMRIMLQEVKDKKKSKKTIESAIRSEMRNKLAPLDDDDDFGDHETSRNLYRSLKRSRDDVCGGSSEFASRPELGRDSLYGVSGSAVVSRVDLKDITLRKRTPEISDSSKKKLLGRAIGKFFIAENIPAHLVTSRHFQDMIATAAELGQGVPLPSTYEIYNTYLKMEVEETKAYVDEQRQLWNKFGCSIMVDSWTGPTKLSVINVMVYSSGKTVFLKSINASSGQIENHQFIFNVLHEVVKEVGAHNVIQVVTSNGSAFEKAGKQLMMKYDLYWTPCASHCIDSMLEDISKNSSIKEVVKDAQNITKLIYNDEVLLVKAREHGEREIVRHGPTRFATNCSTLVSLRNNKSALTKMFSSDWWGNYPFCHTVAGGIVESKVMDPKFWDRVDEVCEIFEPIYNALRLIDTEVIPTMGLLNHVFKRMKDTLGKLQVKQWVLDIVNNMWENQLCQPLHQAAHYLNPNFQYNPNVTMTGEHLRAVIIVFEALYPHDDCSEIGIEVLKFRDAKGIFGSKSAIGGRLTMPAVEWWNMFGNETPAMQKLAIHILSQTASSSACGKNWSTLALIHSKKMNRLAHKRLKQIFFCRFNMKLRTRDEKAEADNVEARDPLEIIQRSMDVMCEETRDDLLLDWIRPVDLDEVAQNPDPVIAARALAEGVDVDRVMKEEVGATSHDYHGLSDGNSAVDSYKLF